MKIRNVIAILCIPMVVVLLVVLAVSAETGDGTVTGRVQLGEKPEPVRGGVFLFDASTGPAPDPMRYLRVPELVEMLKPDGSISIVAPPGIYYLGAIVRRTNGPELGPPRNGDMIIISRDPEQKAVKYTVEAGKTLDAGMLSQAYEYRPPSATPGDPTSLATGISGKVLYVDKQPVAGAVVLAYSSPDMSGLPAYVSERTLADGTYLLRTGGAGKFYLRVRSDYGGGPMVEGGVIGVFGGDKPAPVRVGEHGMIVNTDIVVKQLPPAGPERKGMMNDTVKQKGGAPEKQQGTK
ncbi:MAG: carboxypeptidase regulatory-like domain-containing protein [Nitrospirae bacterium]|nr:carboxypeptidase regulatory-like domain-containing protein [Nitrospirota bacterium]